MARRKRERERERESEREKDRERIGRKTHALTDNKRYRHT